MMQYAVCSKDLHEIEQHLHDADYNDEHFDSIAPTTQNIALQDEGDPDSSESYDLSHDLGIPSVS